MVEPQNCQSPGEIKRREVSWTLTKKLALYFRVQASSGGGRLLDPYVSPEEIKSREVQLGSKSWTSFASVVPQRQCYDL